MRKLAVLGLGLTAALSCTAWAAPETYVIDNSHTFPRFEYTHLGFSNQVHRFNKTSGTITLDRAQKSGSVDITIDAKSVDTGHAVFNEHIQGADFFDTEMFPTITFKSTALKFEGDKLNAVDGNLTLKGVTKPVTLTLTSFACAPHPMTKKEACGANAVTKVKRSDFKMGKNVPLVSDEVTISVSIEAMKK